MSVRYLLLASEKSMLFYPMSAESISTNLEAASFQLDKQKRRR